MGAELYVNLELNSSTKLSPSTGQLGRYLVWSLVVQIAMSNCCYVLRIARFQLFNLAGDAGTCLDKQYLCLKFFFNLHYSVKAIIHLLGNTLGTQNIPTTFFLNVFSCK